MASFVVLLRHVQHTWETFSNHMIVSDLWLYRERERERKGVAKRFIRKDNYNEELRAIHRQPQ